MSSMDADGRLLVDTPSEALAHLAEMYSTHRFVANLTFKRSKKATALAEWEHTMREAERAIFALRAAGKGATASRWREVELFVHAMRDELQMWLLLNEDKAHAAWEALVKAQGNAHCAASNLPDFEPSQQLVEHLDAVERVIFPKQQFFSPAMIIDEESVECSVCQALGGRCDHLPGEIYDGELASRILHHIREIREISLVDNPANKQARAISYSGMDLLTGELA